MPILDKLIPHADKEQIHAGEAYSVWTQTMARYDTLGLTQYMENLIHDSDLKALVKFGTNNVIKPQIKRLEDFAEKYKIPLPPKPPKSVNTSNATDTAGDEAIFRIIFDGAQTALNVHVKEINIATNDFLRSMYRDFLKEDLDNYENMIKYGKFKGWVKNPPTYQH
ncbi:MAG: hypothetical protein APF77_21380 [Clostridia bacterium BRH_c25]|nr:MAG: hypothetical protein APF77_21380 [Clostridia bacterium BRH_c25]